MGSGGAKHHTVLVLVFRVWLWMVPHLLRQRYDFPLKWSFWWCGPGSPNLFREQVHSPILTVKLEEAATVVNLCLTNVAALLIAVSLLLVTAENVI